MAGNGFFIDASETMSIFYSANGFESDFSSEATGHINPASPGWVAAEEIKIIYKLTVSRQGATHDPLT